jgi:ATP-dependent Clp protease ATP-binding subunit ClpA
MPKINVYLPDDLAEAVKAAGLPVSPICQRALEHAVRRVTAIRQVALSGGAEADELTSRLTRFTRRAVSVVRLGGEQARASGSPSVGTGHLLGGILAEGNGLALTVLLSMEIEPAEVRAELDRLSAAGRGAEAGSSPQETGNPGRRFSGPAAGALELAVMESSSLGHNYVGTEHLLLGLAGETEGIAGQALRAAGAELRLARRAVTAAIAGYTHLKTQQSKEAAAAATIGHDMQHINERLSRLEERLAMSVGEVLVTEGPADQVEPPA